MNDLEKYFTDNNDRLIDKWSNYFDIYDRYFSPFRGKEIVLVEIGIFQGGSLQMWKNYFGPKAKIYGIDINPNCKELEEENIQIFIGSQSDRQFLRSLKEKIPPIDILIDDGGHTMKQQIVTFEELYGHVKECGIFLCEDTHSSYHVATGGGYKRNGTFIEYSKNFVDYLHAHHSEQAALSVNDFTRSAKSVHFYDSIVVIEKEPWIKPVRKTTGNAGVVNYHKTPTGAAKTKWEIKKAFLSRINKILRWFRIKGFMWR